MNHYKLYIDFKEGTHDYVSAVLYDFTNTFVAELPQISKPIEKESYTLAWKNGLYSFYEYYAKTHLIGNDVTFSNL